jgi:hypothetical protein
MFDNQNVLEACGKRGGGSCAPIDVESMTDAQLEQTLDAVWFALVLRGAAVYPVVLH